VEWQFSVEKVKGQGHRTSKNLKKLPHIYMFTYGRRVNRHGSGADCKLGVTHC